MPNWEALGTRRFYRDADLLFFEAHGLITLADTQRLYSMGETIAKEYGYSIAVFDARDARGMSSDARRHSVEANNLDRAAAVIGANIIIRTFTTMVHNAMRLLGRPRPLLHFCSNVEEAIQWSVTQRKCLRVSHAVGRREVEPT